MNTYDPTAALERFNALDPHDKFEAAHNGVLRDALLLAYKKGREDAVDVIDMLWTADIPYPQYDIDLFLESARQSGNPLL